jgi:hypothetical protein
LRWWSAFCSDWHAVVLFRDRLGSPLACTDPEPLSLRNDALREAARLLGLRLARV